MNASDMTVRVKREPEGEPLTFTDGLILLVFGFYLAGHFSWWTVAFFVALTWVINMAKRLLYPLADLLGYELVQRRIKRQARAEEKRRCQ